MEKETPYPSLSYVEISAGVPLNVSSKQVTKFQDHALIAESSIFRDGYRKTSKLILMSVTGAICTHPFLSVQILQSCTYLGYFCFPWTVSFLQTCTHPNL